MDKCKVGEALTKGGSLKEKQQSQEMVNEHATGGSARSGEENYKQHLSAPALAFATRTGQYSQAYHSENLMKDGKVDTSINEEFYKEFLSGWPLEYANETGQYRKVWLANYKLSRNRADETIDIEDEFFKGFLSKPMRELGDMTRAYRKTYLKEMELMANWMQEQPAFQKLMGEHPSTSEEPKQ